MKMRLSVCVQIQIPGVNSGWYSRGIMKEIVKASGVLSSETRILGTKGLVYKVVVLATLLYYTAPWTYSE